MVIKKFLCFIFVRNKLLILILLDSQFIHSVRKIFNPAYDYDKICIKMHLW